MLKKLKLSNFTVFAEADLEFSSGLNVIIGENGTGKTHLLKSGYLACNAWPELMKGRSSLGKEKTAAYFADHLEKLFRPDRIGSLSNAHSKNKSRLYAQVNAAIPTVTIRMNHEATPPAIAEELSWDISFTSKAENKISLDSFPEESPTNSYMTRSVYLPSKEMVSFFEGFIALSERHELPFDETFRDLALNLSSPKLKREPDLLTMQIKNLNSVIGGVLRLDGGRFYLVSSEGVKREITLVAEGIRKIATLFHLIANGSLEKGATLFWDEPDANMNPRLVKIIAEVLCNLVQGGIQVVIATHSLFLLRELEILCSQQRFNNAPSQVFALSRGETGVTVQQGKTANDVDPLILLDEELAQSDRYLELD